MSLVCCIFVGFFANVFLVEIIIEVKFTNVNQTKSHIARCHNIISCVSDPVAVAAGGGGLSGAVPGPPHSQAEGLEVGAAPGHHRTPV